MSSPIAATASRLHSAAATPASWLFWEHASGIHLGILLWLLSLPRTSFSQYPLHKLTSLTSCDSLLNATLTLRLP